MNENKIPIEHINEEINKKIGILSHVLVLSNKELYDGFETDPLYKMMLSRCVAQKRFLYKDGKVVNYKLLDLHLFKSKILLGSFDMLSGNEKYDLIRNVIAIYLHLEKKDVTVEAVDRKIKRYFGISIREIKDNVFDKKMFLKKYKLIYDKTFLTILMGIDIGSK